jgi:hypothetical protein
LEQARYEAFRVKRQYNAVDPDNRLVAATLEKDWNGALVKVAKLESEISTIVASTTALSAEEEAEIRELSQVLTGVWNHPRRSVDLKKRIIRTVIKELIIYLQEQKIRLVIHWQGGERTELEVLKNKSFDYPLRTDIETKKIISEDTDVNLSIHPAPLTANEMTSFFACQKGARSCARFPVGCGYTKNETDKPTPAGSPNPVRNSSAWPGLSGFGQRYRGTAGSDKGR